MATVYRSLAWIVGASLTFSAASVHAQRAAQPQEQGELEEVVVTVERVTQSLQSYAGTAVTASQAELDSLGATNLVDLPALLPVETQRIPGAGRLAGKAGSRSEERAPESSCRPSRLVRKHFP